MPVYICRNKNFCSKADSGERFDMPSYAEPKCPECGMQLKAADGSKPAPGPVDKAVQDRDHRPKWALVAAAVAISGAVGSTAFFMRCELPFVKGLACHSSAAGQVDDKKDKVVDEGTQSKPQEGMSAATAQPATAPETAGAMPASGSESLAKANCQKAVEANQLDRVYICNRANAITLSNSGALSATLGKLADAEKDYRAALEKDPDFYGVYLNYAALKVRQDKPAEAVEMIDKSIRRGFRSVEFIDKDPVFERLRKDPVWGPKLKEKLNGVRAQDADKPTAG